MELIVTKDLINIDNCASFYHDELGEISMRDIELSNALKLFYNENYYPGYILSDQKLFSWMFRNNGGRVAALMLGEKVIAHQGHVPVVFTDGIEDYRGFISASTMVDVAYRRKGLMSKLRSWVQSRYDMAASIGGSDLGIALYTAMGYKHYGNMFRMVAVPNTELARQVSRENEKLIATCALSSKFNNSVRRIENFSALVQQINDLRNKILEPGKYFGVKRDGYFLQWRYADHPIFEYQRYGLWSGDVLKAMIVFRIERIAQTENEVIRITELIGEGSDLQELIAATVLHESIASKVAWIDWFTTNRSICESIITSGFQYDDKLAATLPIFCSPVDYSKAFYPVMFWSKDKSRHATMTPLDQWYLTKGDGDADRPNKVEGYTRIS